MVSHIITLTIYHPVTILWLLHLRKDSSLENWELAHAKLIYEAGDTSDPTNF